MVGMRYGNPSLADAVRAVHQAGATRVILAPMFPQYASASTGTAVQRAFDLLGALPRVPDVSVLPPFFGDAGFLGSVTSKIKQALQSSPDVDHLLLSYHGLPLHQVKNIHATCVGEDSCCAALTANNASCYRAQCMATTRALVDATGLDRAMVSTSFQSRLGKAVWLLPNTEHVLVELANKGVKKLAVACPSFVSDCLETVEEIGVRARHTFTAAGGQELVFIPCVNDDQLFVDSIASMIERASA
jgi:ferrochelatase